MPNNSEAEEAAARKLAGDIGALINAAPTTKMYSDIWALTSCLSIVVAAYSKNLVEAEKLADNAMAEFAEKLAINLAHKFPN